MISRHRQDRPSNFPADVRRLWLGCFCRSMGVFAVLFGLVAGSAAQPASLDLQLAREPAIVTTAAKREYSGLLDGFRDGRLFLRVVTDGGEVGYSFAPAEIARLVFPGAEFEAQAMELWDRGATAEALPLLEALGRQRLRYLPVLNEAQRAALWLLLRASDRAGNPLATISYVNQLRPLARTSDEEALLRDAELGAHVRLGQVDEIRRLARAWCAAADPAGGSALGWRILAQLAYDDGDFERARWIALQPIVFSGFLPMDQIDGCYAIAIGAAHRLRDFSHGRALWAEMQDRELPWPDAPEFAAVGDFYRDPAATEAVRFELPVSEISPHLNAPLPPQSLDDVRKLVQSPAP